ncbi:MAG: hypothetical protein V3T90_10870 [Anaerolineae bacterium]
MSTKRALLVVLVASGVMLAVGVGPRLAGNAYALPPVQEPDPTGVTIPYPGRLAGDAGQPVADGAYDFTFALYDAETGGESLWSEVQEGVAVQEGAFNALLGSENGIPVEALNSGERWLAVGVRGPGESDFTALTPRQCLGAASLVAPASPAAPALTGMTCAHTHEGETWSATGGTKGLYLSTQGGYALEGWSSGNIGVLGISTGGAILIPSGMHGLYGIGDGYGVVGTGGNGAGWFGGYDDNNDIFLGGATGRINTDSNDGDSKLYLSSNADVWIKLDNDGGENHAFRIKSSGGGDLCYTEETTGDWNCTGNKNAVVETDSYGWRKLHAMESPEVWFEDFGTASLVDGEAMVAFDPIFADTVNLEVDYHVFVTPLCQEPVLLFVTGKSATAFTVRGVTLDGQPAACSFDYRVVVKRLGYEDVRLEETTWQEGE